MNTAVVGWMVMRALRWLLILVYLAYALHFMLHREVYIDTYGHIFLTNELLLFAFPLAAIFVSFLEMMMREKAGLPRPAAGRNWLPRTSSI